MGYVHSVRHLVQCVVKNGPLWVFSCFPYENKNGELASFMTGTKQVHLQILERSSIFVVLKKMMEGLPPNVFSSSTRFFLQQVKAEPLLDKNRPSSSYAVEICEGLWSMEKLSETRLTAAEFTAWTTQLGGVSLDGLCTFSRLWKKTDQQIIHSAAYTRLQRHIQYVRECHYPGFYGYVVVRRFLVLNQIPYAVVTALVEHPSSIVSQEQLVKFDNTLREEYSKNTGLEINDFQRGVNRSLKSVWRWKFNDPVFFLPISFLQEEVAYIYVSGECAFISKHRM
eukprot:Lithocolla_globosa_v1_NODE_3326_length_1698_cov_8.685332.p1 type:complete len:282 gc:universal NODE_3326_length_1698_cov_8.685332:993-148(-)